MNLTRRDQLVNRQSFIYINITRQLTFYIGIMAIQLKFPLLLLFGVQTEI